MKKKKLFVSFCLLGLLVSCNASSLSSQINDLTNENNILKDENLSLIDQRNQLLEEQSETLTLLEAIMARLEAQDEKLSLLDTIETKLGDLDMIQTKLNEFETIKDKLEDLNSIQEQLDLIKLKLDTFDSVIVKLDDLANKVNSIDATLEATNSQIQSILTKLEDLDSLAEQIDLLASELNTVKSNIQTANDNIQLVLTKLGDLDTMQDELDSITLKLGKLDELSQTLAGIVSDLDSLDNSIITIGNNLLAALSKFDDLGQQLEDLENSLEGLQIMVENLNEIARRSDEREVNSYLLLEGFDEDYISFFKEQTEHLLGKGYSLSEIIDYFEENFEVDNFLFNNDDLSTTSHLTFSKPKAKQFNDVTVDIYYHDALIKTHTLFDTDNFEFDFDAPNYGKYEAVVSVNYDDVTIETEHDLGVTSSHYNMAVLNGTLPILLYTADSFLHESNYPTFVSLTDRPATYIWDELPENTYKFPSFVFDQYGAANWRTGGMVGLSDWIKELHDTDPTSTFTLNCVDNYSGVAVYAFDRYQIPENLWNVNIWTDGSFTMGTLNGYTNSILNARKGAVTAYRQSVKNLNSSEILNSNKSAGDLYSFALAFVAVVQNSNYYVATLSGLTVSDPNVLDVINQKVTVKAVPDLFDSLIFENKINEFEYLLGTRWGEEPEDGVSYYFNSPKGKYLLILGTSTAGENPTATTKYYTFDEYINIIIDNYGDEYQILYKGHPAYPSSTARKAMFATHNIVDLKAQIPVEVLMYIYPNVYIGGYRGTSFVSSQEGQTIFFFGTQAYIRSLASLRDLMDTTNIFENTVYIYDETK